MVNQPPVNLADTSVRFTSGCFLRAGDYSVRPTYPREAFIEILDVHLGVGRIPLEPAGLILVDIDGTVADLSHRRPFISSKPKNYPAFEKGVPFDTPIQPIIDAVRRLYAANWTVVMCSGRSEAVRETTVQWLNKYGVPFHDLFMRPEFEVDPKTGEPKLAKSGLPKGDYRKDSIVKFELLERIRKQYGEPDLVLDDRNQVVEMWRANGVPCIQVAEGDF